MKNSTILIIAVLVAMVLGVAVYMSIANQPSADALLEQQEQVIQDY